jgi:hypothetical protein
MDREQVLTAYEQAWTHEDEDQVRTALSSCLSDVSTYQSPLTDTVRGVEGLTNLILDLPVMFPGATLRRASTPAFHNDVACFAWELRSTARIRTLGRDYGTTLGGIDVLEFDDEHRISRVTAFFGFGHQDAPAPTGSLDLGSARTQQVVNLPENGARGERTWASVG